HHEGRLAIAGTSDQLEVYRLAERDRLPVEADEVFVDGDPTRPRSQGEPHVSGRAAGQHVEDAIPAISSPPEGRDAPNATSRDATSPAMSCALDLDNNRPANATSRDINDERPATSDRHEGGDNPRDDAPIRRRPASSTNRVRTAHVSAWDAATARA